MCGFAGCLNTGSSIHFTEHHLQEMVDSLKHRGPDASGTWIDHDAGLFLAHRRLAILDLSEQANQPMISVDSGLSVVFNGEIYNHRTLRSELTAKGFEFQTDHSDTEVLLIGYAAWGLQELLRRLDGDFSFALWDRNREDLILARDRSGVKPLYFARAEAGLYFASEIKAILTDRRIPRRINPSALSHYLTFLTTPAPLTLFDGIYKLPAAHWMIAKPTGEIRTGNYWSPLDSSIGTVVSPNAGWDAAPQVVRSLLTSAVQKRLESDVPTGVFLSGGVDSSSILAIASELSQEPVKTFTVGFDQETSLNEFEEAREVAKRFGAQHSEVVIGQADMRAYLTKLVYHQDEPLADWVCIPLHFVSELARANGVKVVQVGEGADEQFAGYSSYLQYLRMYSQFWRPYSRWTPHAVKSSLASLARVGGERYTHLSMYFDIIDRAGRQREPFWSGAIGFSDSMKRGVSTPKLTDACRPDSFLIDIGLAPESYFGHDSFPIIEHYRDELLDLHPDHDILQRMVNAEYHLRLPELLLMRVDKITMESSVEARVPFLDQALVEYTSRIPLEVKLQNGAPKSLLKTAVRGLIPDEVIDRPKKGFGAPMADWLRGDFGWEAREAILSSPLLREGWLDGSFAEMLIDTHLSGKRDFGLQVWTLFNLVTWYEFWIECA